MIKRRRDEAAENIVLMMRELLRDVRFEKWVDEDCQKCKGCGRSRSDEVRGADAKEARLEKEISDLKQESRRGNEAAHKLKIKIGDLEEKLNAANMRLSNLVVVDGSFADVLENRTQVLVKNIEEYRKIVAAERSGTMVIDKKNQPVPDSETP